MGSTKPSTMGMLLIKTKIEFVLTHFAMLDRSFVRNAYDRIYILEQKTNKLLLNVMPHHNI